MVCIVMQMDSQTPAQRLLACLGDPSRFRLLVRLSEKRLCVSELASEVGLSQSCTTRHLQALTVVGLVQPAREGKRVVYALRDGNPEIERLVHWVRGTTDLTPAAVLSTPRPQRDRARPPRRPNATAAARPAPPAMPVDGGALTKPVPARDGAVDDSDAIEIRRPPRAADLEDFLL
jgi:DNA-binding transcriptional ArsR family regulator